MKYDKGRKNIIKFLIPTKLSVQGSDEMHLIKVTIKMIQSAENLFSTSRIIAGDIFGVLIMMPYRSHNPLLLKS